jgi:hypothetical protein
VASEEVLEVAKYSGFWGQDVASRSTEPASDFNTYFGDLEFVFDGNQAETTNMPVEGTTKKPIE